MAIQETIWQKKEPILKNLAVFNGAGAITIANNPCTFTTLPHGSPVEADSISNTFTLIKGFESYLGVASATQTIKKEHLLGVGDAFNIGGAVTVVSIDTTSSEDYDTVVFSGSITTVTDTVYSQVPTAGKASLTNGEAPINNDVATYQVFVSVLSEGLIDTNKLILPAILDDTALIKGITNAAIIFA
jgi:hypothetical protein